MSSYWPLYGNHIGYKIKNVCTIESDYIVIEQPRSVHVASKTISPYKKQNLGKPVNTKYSEVSCLVAHDGKLLVLNRDNHPGNRYPSSENDDVWFSEWKNSEWDTPVNIEGARSIMQGTTTLYPFLLIVTHLLFRISTMMMGPLVVMDIPFRTGQVRNGNCPNRFK